MNAHTPNLISAKQTAKSDQNEVKIRRPRAAVNFPPLEIVTKPNLTTAEAAHYLNRGNKTLRLWACGAAKGPLVPKRINGRLAWATADVKAIAGVPA